MPKIQSCGSVACHGPAKDDFNNVYYKACHCHGQSTQMNTNKLKAKESYITKVNVKSTLIRQTTI